MSIEGITNYEHYDRMNTRPEWVRLERLDYCDQGTPAAKPAWMNAVAEFFGEIFRGQKKQEAFS